MVANNAKSFMIECMDTCAGEEAAAVELAKKQLQEDKTLFDSVIWPLLDWALPELANECTRSTRSQILRPMALANPDDTSGLKSRMRAARSRYLNFPLKGGKRLGDSTREEMEGQRDLYCKQKEGNARMETVFIGLLCLMPARGRKPFSTYASEKQVAAVFEVFE